MRRRTVIAAACLACLLVAPTVAAAGTLKAATARAYALKHARSLYRSLIDDGATGYSVDSCRRLTKLAFSCTEVIEVDDGDITCISRVIVSYRTRHTKQPRTTAVPDSSDCWRN